MRRLSRFGPALLWAALVAWGCGGGGGVDDAVYDFAAEFPRASVQQEIYRLLPPRPRSESSLVAGWSPAESRDEARDDSGRKVWGLGDASEVALWVSQVRDLEIRFEVWAPGTELDSEPKSESESTMTVALNEDEIGVVALPAAPGREQSLRLPASLLQRGRNLLSFRYGRPLKPPGPPREMPLSASAAWGHLVVRGARPGTDPEVDCHWRGRSLCLPLGSRVDFFLRLEQPAELRIDDLLAWEGKDDSLVVTVAARDATGRSLGSMQLTPSQGLGRESRLRLDPSDEPIAIAWSVEPSESASGPARGVKLLAPRLQAVGGLVAGPVARDDGPRAGNPPAEPPTTRPNVLLYVVDSLRADRLGVYGYDRPTSPRLDALAAEGVVFEKARAHSSWTRPTMSSIMTGLHPGTHGAERNLTRLPTDLPVMAEYLSAGGYQTAAVVTNGFVSRQYGFGQGFDHFVHLKADPKSATFHQNAEAVNREIFQWLQEDRTEAPFFVWAHTIDPHAPYVPQEPYSSQFAPSVAEDSPLREMSFVRKLEERERVGARVRQRLSNLYDAEVAFNDAQFGALLDRLKQLDLYDDTLIVFVSDHGEEFADHGRWQHTRSLFQELVHIPWVLKAPGGRWGGARVDEVVRQVDVLPTILDFAGLIVPAGLEGRSVRSLMAAADEAPSAPQRAHASLDSVGLTVRSIEMGRFKLVLNLGYDRPHRRVELYDLVNDPEERVDLSRSQPVWAGFLRAEILRHLQTTSTAANEQIEISAEERRALEALGYID